MKQSITRRKALAITGSMALALALVVASPAPVSAETWPARPVRIVIGFPPGGSVDILGRVLGEEIAKGIGQRVVIENKPGAIGTIALNTVKAAPADGYSLLLGTNPQLSPGASATETSYDELEPIALASVLPVVLLANPQAPFNDLPSMIAAAKAATKAGSRQLSSSSPGPGSPMHMAIEALNRNAGIALLHVPYNGGPAATIDAVSGAVDMVTVGLPTALSYVKSGRLRPLAVMQDRRSEILPDVPTVAEAARIAGVDFVVWLGLFAPAKTPAPIVQRLRDEVRRALADPGVRERLVGAAIEPRYGDGQALTDMLRAQHANLHASSAAGGGKRP